MTKSIPEEMKLELISKAYDNYGVSLFRLAMMYMGNKSDAEDAVHDVFVRYMMRMPQFKDETHEKAWFMRVCINVCKDKLKSFAMKSVPIDDVLNYVSTDNDISMFEHLMGLSEEYRVVVHLKYVEGYSISEISKILSVTESTVKLRLFRAREQLKRNMEEVKAYV